MNSIQFTKSINHRSKLLEDLKSDAAVGQYVETLIVDGDQGEVLFTQNLTQTQVDAAFAVINNFVDESVLEETEQITSDKEKFGREAITKIVAKLNENGDYFTSADQGIEGSQLMWPVEAYIKRGFFVFAYRKFCLTIRPSSVTVYDANAKDIIESSIRQLCKDHSAMSDPVLDAIRDAPASPEGGPYNV